MAANTVAKFNQSDYNKLSVADGATKLLRILAKEYERTEPEAVRNRFVDWESYRRSGTLGEGMAEWMHLRRRFFETGYCSR